MTGNPFVIVPLLIFTVAAGAQPGTDPRIARWRESLLKTNRLIQEKQYEEAIPILHRVTNEMVASVGAEDAATAFALVLTHRAIAEMGVGRVDDGLWYWHLAVNTLPAIADGDLSLAGEIGERLKEHSVPALDEPVCDLDSTRLGFEFRCEPQVEAPKIRKRTPLRYPECARLLEVEGELVAHVRLTADGRLESPRVVQRPPTPTMAYLILESLRSWTFTPARQNGKPVPVTFKIHVVYRLQ